MADNKTMPTIKEKEHFNKDTYIKKGLCFKCRIHGHQAFKCSTEEKQEETVKPTREEMVNYLNLLSSEEQAQLLDTEDIPKKMTTQDIKESI